MKIRYPIGNKCWLLVALCFVVYWNSLHGQFISDDIGAIVHNPHVGTVDWLNPQSVVYGIIVHFFGLNPIAFHVASVMLHATCTILVFFLLLRVFPEIPSLIGAIIFAVNPIHTEAVAWISGSAHLYIALGFLSVLLLYRKHFWWALGVYLYFLQSPIGYAWLVTMPILLFAIEWRKSALFLLSALVRTLLVIPQIHARQAAVQLVAGQTFYQHWPIVVAHSIISNLWALFWPFKLMLYHEPILANVNFFIPEMFFAFVVIPYALYYFYKHNQALFLGLSIFLTFLIPTMLPKPVCWMVASRYLVMPSILISIIMALIASKAQKWHVLWYVIAYIFLVFAFRTVDRNGDWHSPERFWRQAIETRQDNYRNYNNMGQVYVNQWNMVFAEEMFRQSLKINPEQKEAWFNISQCFKFEGKPKEAEYALKRSEQYARSE